MLLGAALLAAVPASAAEFPPKIGAFAYPAGHAPAIEPVSFDAALPTDDFPPSPPKPPTPAPTVVASAAAAATPAAAAGTPATPAAPALTRTELCAIVAFEAATNKLPLRFFANLIEQESRFNPRVVSHKGAQGIAQFMPGTAAEWSLNDPFEPIQALNASAKFLSYLLARFGNLGLAAAAYNAGPGRVSDWLAKRGGMPAETQHYVRRITGLPVEEWGKQDAKDAEISFPLLTQCPQFRLPGDPVLMRMAAQDVDVPGRPGASKRRARGWWFGKHISILKYVDMRPR
jgi:hypothetical protein